MLKNLGLIILTGLLFSCPNLYAATSAPRCHNMTAGKGDISKNNILNEQLFSSKDPLILSWRAQNTPSSIINKACPPIQSNWSKIKELAPLAKVQAAAFRPKKIRSECIQSSLQREVDNEGFICKGNTPVKFENQSSKTPCITSDIVNYMQFAVNEALDCVSPADNPIDARFIMKKYNNETGFNFFLGYSGGVGLGQLTSDPVKEIAGWSEKSGKKTIFNEGQAKPILEELMNSAKPSCQAFKKVLQADLQKPPPLPNKKANYCHWLSIGNGLTRNLFYSMAYYRWVRDAIVLPKISEKAPSMAKDPDIVNAFTLVAYGPGGLTQAKSLIQRLRLNKSSNKAEVLKKLKQASEYYQQTEEKMTELSPSGLTGDACVQ